MDILEQPEWFIVVQLERSLRQRVAGLEKEARARDEHLRDLRETTRTVRIAELEQQLRDQILEVCKLEFANNL